MQDIDDANKQQSTCINLTVTSIPLVSMYKRLMFETHDTNYLIICVRTNANSLGWYRTESTGRQSKIAS